jgi:hypothetical protein
MKNPEQKMRSVSGSTKATVALSLDSITSRSVVRFTLLREGSLARQEKPKVIKRNNHLTLVADLEFLSNICTPHSFNKYELHVSPIDEKGTLRSTNDHAVFFPIIGS